MTTDHLDDIRELFHWYVPETDYKAPLNDSDKCYVYVYVAAFLALILGLSVFVLFCKFKHRWLVNAKCAFCNCIARVWRAKLYWWFCNHCQRVNGYPKDSFAQTDSSLMDEVHEPKDHSLVFKFPSVRNNKIPSPSNQRTRISYSKNDLNVSTIVSSSPKTFPGKNNDSIGDVHSRLEDENYAETETSFQKIKNKIKDMLNLDRAIEKLSKNTDDDCSGNLIGNSGRVPDDMSNLRKVHMQLILDDVNRRFELLNAEKMLCANMKQMRELVRSLRHAKKDASSGATRDNRFGSIRKRNTFFERTIDHSIASPNVLNNREVDSKKDAATARLATLEAHLTELREMHADEITLLKSQIKNKSSILKKIEHLKFGVVEFFNKLQEDHFNFLMGKLPSEDAQEFQVEKQISADESGYLSESAATKNHRARAEAMSVILEESDEIMSPHHIQVLKQTFDRFNRDSEQRATGPRSAARIVKPIRGGQRPAAKVVVLQ